MLEKRGFTIIELIVAIAIVAVLAAVVMVNATKYIVKGKDSGLKSNINAIDVASGIFIAENGTFSSFCEDAETIKILDKISSNQCHDDSDRWVICAPMNENTSKAWCADNTGVKKEINASDCRQNTHQCN